ncbi:tetratricopeptide repeat protein [Undibacterium sp. Di26W]|uniref:tetratricopeptide repeat protein n=1 Tax=Undibacterium sp. Di26W TaxID=3413035 RepID=UPI003BEFD106
MFKRLLSVFSSNKSSGQTAPASTPKPATPATPATPSVTPTVKSATTSSPAATPAEIENGEPITAYDAQGRQVMVPRNEWREKVLLPSIAEKSNDPDALYNIIMTALNDGFAKDLVPAADRLLAIDTIAERGYTVHGIVLLENGRLPEAEATLKAGMQKIGATGTLLTNLAKVIWEAGDQVAAKDILWQAIQAAPNLENSLMWWLAIEREQHGDVAYLEALHTVCTLPQTWRAQLVLAQFYLEQNLPETAVNLYQKVLHAKLYDASALASISGALGSHGHITNIIELIAPVYQPERHDPMAGLNLLRAYQQLRRNKEGQALLNKMRAVDLGPYQHYLDEFARSFGEMRVA